MDNLRARCAIWKLEQHQWLISTAHNLNYCGNINMGTASPKLPEITNLE